MKVYVWERLSFLTDEYHHSGGVTVIAESLERARQLVLSKTPEPWYESSGKENKCNIEGVDPDFQWELKDYYGDETVFIFPNAGCC